MAGPSNSVAPVVSVVTGYEARETHDVTCTTGTWSGSGTITYTYQWRVPTGNIQGLASQTVTVPKGLAGQALECTVTATDSGGSTSTVSSNDSGTIEAAAGMAHVVQDGKWRARPIRVPVDNEWV